MPRPPPFPVRRVERLFSGRGSSTVDKVDLSAFHPAVERWFRSAFDRPTSAQTQGWQEIAAGHHTLIEAPTGSGKTLAAFLWCLHDLLCRPPDTAGVQVLYISPLKALNNDIQRNLQAPLAGIRAAAAELGLPMPDISVDVRTGDTPPALRQRQVRRPPEVFITTPESLYLLLTARNSQDMFRGLRYVILDEIHAVASTKRGVHLALTLERLEEAIRPPEFQEPHARHTPPAPFPVRIGLSATQRPLELVARLLGGYDDEGQPRPVSIVQAHQDKQIEIALTYPFASRDEEADFMHHAARIILEEAAGRRSTLVFCNARHVTERLSEVLNSEAGRQVAIAHHGSIARERRLEIEQALKQGELPLLVATSSLELGIDVGSVDLVIQVGSTKSVSRALQRVGRAGHQVGAVSRGTVIAQHPSDLLDAAAGVRGVARRAIEHTHTPQACLDVLSQQIVAMCAARPTTVEDVLRIARRAHPFRTLSRAQLENLLAMLAGRYVDARFEGLRPRLEWDAETGAIRPLPGALRLAVINGGTIPDRGYLSVELVPGAEGQPSKKLGELDEEFAAELYVGGRPAFSLGTSVWAVEAVERDRVLVRPAPGEPYQIPFWRNDRLGRSMHYGVPELARDIAARLRQPQALVAAWLGQECGLDEKSALALLDYIRHQYEATGQVPNDQNILVEAFQDEIGDWRVVIHSLFGAAVNGAWAFALKPRLREALGGIDPLVLHNDDGIIMRLPPIETPPLTLAEQLLAEVRADTVEELLIGELADAPMLALRFREAAQRALLLPKPRPNRRTPLWLRRQRAADLLSIVRRKEGFPVLQEAVRECLHDTWDINGLRSILRRLESGDISLAYRETPSPSPFAASLVWDFGIAFGEEGDAPRGECRAAYLALNRDLLRETLEAEDLRQLLDPEVIAELEAELATACSCHAPASAVEAQVPASGCPAPDPRHAEASMPLLALLQEHMQHSGPASARSIAARLALPLALVERHLNLLVEASRLSRGEYRPDGHEPEYCAPLILARLHRESLRRAREQVAPVELARYAAFLPAWQGVHGGRLAPTAEPGAAPRTPGAGSAAAPRRALEALLHLPLTREQWQLVLAARFGEDATGAVDSLTSRGLLEWRAAGNGQRELVEPGAPPRPTGEARGFGAERVLALLRQHGALFAADIARRLARAPEPLTPAEVEHALALLEEAGLATNDLFSGTGRWSAAPPGDGDAGQGAEAPAFGRRRWATGARRAAVHRGSGLGTQDAALDAYVEALLRRYGVVSREIVRGEKGPFRWPEIERLLHLWEWRGRAVRGDFIKELSGPQYARREAVDLLREWARSSKLDSQGSAVLLPWDDPANIWRAVHPAFGSQRPARLAPRGTGRFIVLLDGLPLLTIGGWGKDLTPGPAWNDGQATAAASALRDLAGFSDSGAISLERWRGGSVLVSPLAGALREAGFARAGLRLVYRRPASMRAAV
jgi:ATP-dependent Lhr-like helicase